MAIGICIVIEYPRGGSQHIELAQSTINSCEQPKLTGRGLQTSFTSREQKKKNNRKNLNLKCGACTDSTVRLGSYLSLKGF